MKLLVWVPSGLYEYSSSPTKVNSSRVKSSGCSALISAGSGPR
jgi:hypothetical protein